VPHQDWCIDTRVVDFIAVLSASALPQREMARVMLNVTGMALPPFDRCGLLHAHRRGRGPGA
jgi:hypothetical protein